MKTLISILLLISLAPLKSQNLWLKAYGGVGREPRLKLIHNLSTAVFTNSAYSSNSTFVMPAIGLESRKGKFWEIGFSWEFKKSANIYSDIQVPPTDSIQMVDLGATAYKSFDVVIEYYFPFKRKVGKRWQPCFGIAMNPHWSELNYTPHQSFLYPEKSYLTGVHWGLVPRIQYGLTKNLNLDLNAALFMVSTNYEHYRHENPALTERQQTNGIFSIDLLKQYWLRLGLAWKIWSKPKQENPSN